MPHACCFPESMHFRRIDFVPPTLLLLFDLANDILCLQLKERRALYRTRCGVFRKQVTIPLRTTSKGSALNISRPSRTVVVYADAADTSKLYCHLGVYLSRNKMQLTPHGRATLDRMKQGPVQTPSSNRKRKLGNVGGGSAGGGCL